MPAKPFVPNFDGVSLNYQDTMEKIKEPLSKGSDRIVRDLDAIDPYELNEEQLNQLCYAYRVRDMQFGKIINGKPTVYIKRPNGDVIYTPLINLAHAVDFAPKKQALAKSEYYG